MAGRRLALAISLSLVAPLAGAARAEPAPAVALDPADAILAAFADHDVVALGEGNHGNLPGHAFRLALLRDPRFAAAVNDIVVEFGNARYQGVIDRFTNGEEVPDAELRLVWRETTQGNPVWDGPIYEEFFRAVREVNAALPTDRKLRVLLGDVPIDWSAVQTVEDYRRQPQKNDAFVAELVEREVLARGRKALVIYGDMHLLRRPLPYKAPDGVPPEHVRLPEWDSIVGSLEANGARVFSVTTETAVALSRLQPDIGDWLQPKLALLEGTPLGQAPFTFYYRFPLRILQGNGVAADVLVDPDRAPPMQSQFDGILYVGPPSTIRYAFPSPDICRDEAYLRQRFARMEMLGWGAQIEPAKQYCAAVAPPAPAQPPGG